VQCPRADSEREMIRWPLKVQDLTLGGEYTSRGGTFALLNPLSVQSS
jgi:hypothetical protein